MRDRSQLRLALMALCAALLGAGGFLIISTRFYGLGFPLDDAWIHQTYARNLALRGEWAFLPGVPSSGSTSPAWVVLLALGYLLRIEPLAWSYGLGVALLLCLSWVGWRWLKVRGPAAARWAWLAPLLLALEWHLIWLALSGMEALLYATLVVVVFLLLERNAAGWKVGALIGLAVWVRPDGLTLLLPLLIWLAAKGDGRGQESVGALAGLALVVLPYLAFNQALGGSPWPTTYYAKQAEYSVLRQAPWLSRLGRQLLQPLIGVGAVLVPGILLVAVDDLARRRWARLAPLAWALAYLAMYATRLPVTYQHGRYAMPTIPVLVLLGLEGLARMLEGRGGRWLALAGRTLLVAALAVVWLFWYLGARAYARDVAVIESEMVAAAQWVAQHTEQDALIAAHDIGALGYYGGREILDLAGLVSAEVIPFMRDEAALARYLDARGADYLMTFPGWYPVLSAAGELLYSTGGSFSPAAGGENMAVYRWPRSPSP